MVKTTKKRVFVNPWSFYLPGRRKSKSAFVKFNKTCLKEFDAKIQDNHMGDFYWKTWPLTCYFRQLLIYLFKLFCYLSTVVNLWLTERNSCFVNLWLDVLVKLLWAKISLVPWMSDILRIGATLNWFNLLLYPPVISVNKTSAFNESQ